MESTRARKVKGRRRDESGIALFMVIAAMTVLSILVTEFAYVSSVNKQLASDGLDQVRALYLAKSGFKLSLLRLKAYDKVKGFIQGQGGNSGGGIPGLSKMVIERVWSFPFFYPFPSNVPGMTTADKDRIAAFEKSTSLEGHYSATIISESAKYNLNSILAPFAPQPSPSPSASPNPNGGDDGFSPPGQNPNQPGGGPSPNANQFNVEAARNNLGQYLENIWLRKLDEDPEFGNDYRDLRIPDLLDSIVAWADRSYEPTHPPAREYYPPKKAPFYTLSELHMISPIDDALYNLFAPALTVSATPGVNINSMEERVLKALVPQMTKEEITDFFKFRDSEEEDNYFKSPEDFFTYLGKNVAAFQNRQADFEQFKQKLNSQVKLVTNETNFKITVQAQVNQATRLIEAWVTLGDDTGGKAKTPPTGPTSPFAASGGMGSANTPAPTPSAGLKVTFMRIL